MSLLNIGEGAERAVVVKLFGKLLASAVFTFALIEIGLRAVPSVVPLGLLTHFADAPRTGIARSRGLPTRRDTVLVERDDGGPPLRIFKPFTNRRWPRSEDDRATSVTMDDFGFCNPPDGRYALPKIELVTLGDSFTECHAIRPEETWTVKLGERIGIRSYNFGLRAVGINEHLQLLKNFAIAKSPDIVVLNVYEGNDLRDAEKNRRHRRRKGHADDESEAAWWRSRSYASNLLYALWVYEPKQTRTNFRYRLSFPGAEVPFNPDNTDRDEVRFARRWREGRLDPEVFEIIEKALATYGELAKRHGFLPVVAYTPSAHTAYASRVTFEDASLAELMPWFSRSFRSFFRERAERFGYVFVDLTPALRKAAERSRPGALLYSRDDLHLTPAGHEVVAEALATAARGSWGSGESRRRGGAPGEVPGEVGSLRFAGRMTGR